MLVEIGSQLFVSVRLSFCLSDGLWPDRTDHLRDTRTARGPAGPRRIVGVVNPCPTEHCVEFESNKNQHMMSMHAFRQISNWTSSSSFEYFFLPVTVAGSCLRHTCRCRACGIHITVKLKSLLMLVKTHVLVSYSLQAPHAVHVYLV